MESMFKLRSTPPSLLSSPNAVPFLPKAPSDSTIVFDGVCFEYPASEGQGEGRMILKKLSFKIEGGKTVAVVGASGCGESGGRGWRRKDGRDGGER